MRAGEIERHAKRWPPGIVRGSDGGPGGRLPYWARDGLDTSDLVQDTLLQTFKRITKFEPQRDGALRAYLRLAVDNRIRDEMRRVARRPRVDPTETIETTELLVDGASTPLEQSITDETWARYLQGLRGLTPRERRLIVGRAEMGYSFKQLALIDGRGSPDAARMALRRALLRLSDEMPDS